MAALPTDDELDKRVTIKLHADAANLQLGLDANYLDPFDRWARIRPAGPMVHYTSGQAQEGEAVTHFIDMRRGTKTLPELMTSDRVIEHKGRRYRILRAIDMEGAGLFTSVECKDIGPVPSP